MPKSVASSRTLNSCSRAYRKLVKKTWCLAVLWERLGREEAAAAGSFHIGLYGGGKGRHMWGRMVKYTGRGG